MLNAIKELINEKKTIMESTNLILEDDQLDDSIILGEEASEPEDTSEPTNDIEEASDNKDDDNEEVPFKDEKDKSEEKDEENTTDEEENDLMDAPMDNGEEDNEVPTDDGSDNSSEADIIDSPVDDNPSDNPVPETDDILDQPVDSAPEDSSDPFDDILSTEINLRTNTMSDILPTPPAHAADAVPSDEDDLMNQRIDSGFGSDTNTLPETNPTNLPVQEEDDFMDQSLDNDDLGTEEANDVTEDDTILEAANNDDDDDDEEMDAAQKEFAKAFTELLKEMEAEGNVKKISISDWEKEDSVHNRFKKATDKIKDIIRVDALATKQLLSNVSKKVQQAKIRITKSKIVNKSKNNSYKEDVELFDEGFDLKKFLPKYREIEKMQSQSKEFLNDVNQTVQEFNTIIKNLAKTDNEKEKATANNLKELAAQLLAIQEKFLKIAETRHKVIDKLNTYLRNSSIVTDKDIDAFIRDMNSINKVNNMLEEKLNELNERRVEITSKMRKLKPVTESVDISKFLIEAITLGDEGSADSTLSDEDAPTETQEAPAEVSSDETPTEETPTETQEAPSDETPTEQAPDEENSVTSAVKDKVAEAETNDDSTTPESQETAKSNEGSVEILKKLASLTKGIEEAKKAVMDKIK